MDESRRLLSPRLKVRTSIKSDRKTIPYILGDDVFVLTAALADGIDPKFSDNSYINVYNVDALNYKASFALTIDARALGLDTLRITDIAQDENKFLYVTHNSSLVIRFKYLASNRVDKVQYYSYTDGPETFYKVAVIVDHEDTTRVVVAGSTKILELIWNDEAKYFREYSFGEFSYRIRDLQINSRMIMVQSPTDYYFYKIGDTSYEYLLYTTPTLGSIGLLSQTSPQAVVVGDKRSLSYIVSNGYLEVIRPNSVGQNTTVTVTATSLNREGQKVTCFLNFLVSVLNDTTQPQVYKLPPVNLSTENPAILRFKLSDYVVGPQLRYKTHISPGVSYYLEHVDFFDLDGPQDSYSLVDTYSIDSDNYYRLSVSASAFQIDTCSGTASRNIACQSTRNIKLGGRPLAFSVFQRPSQEMVVAIVSSDQNNTVSFHSISSDKQYKDLLVDLDCIITDLDVTSDFIYVTSGATSSVYIYKPELDVYPLVTVLDREAMNKLVPGLTIFKPRELAISPYNPNILFVKNADSVIILKVTTNKISYISNIKTISPTSGLSERIVVGSQNFLIIRAANAGVTSAIYEYGIYDIFRPIFMREVELIDTEVAYPVQLTNSFGGDFVYVKTRSVGADQNYSITALRMAKPAIASNHYSVSASQNSGFAAVDVSGISILQVDSATPGNGGATSSALMYYEPTLTVLAAIQDGSFLKRFIYGLTVESPTTALNFETNLDVIDYQATILPNGDTTTTIKLPVSTNSLSVPIDIDSWFTGSVAHYDISCPYCDGKQVKISDHVTRIAQSNLDVANQYVHFRQDKKLWILSQTYLSIVSEDKLEQLSVLTFNVSQETVCSNWVLWDDITVLIYCNGGAEHFFLLAQASADHSSGKIVGKITVEQKYQVSNPMSIKLNAQRRILVLDATSNVDSVGKLFVFNISAQDAVTIVGEAILSASDFGGLEGDRINDFDIFAIPSLTPESDLLLVTLKDLGLGYGVFDPQSSSAISFLPIGVIQLRNNDILHDYQITNNFYLQIEHLATTSTPESVVYNIIVTTSFGEHFQLILNYQIDAAGISFREFNLVNVYSKYGNELVLNWAHTLPFSDNGKENYLLVGYYDLAKSIESLAVYPIGEPDFHKVNTINFFSSVEIVGPLRSPSAFLFNSSKKDIRMATNYPLAKLTTLSTLSHTVNFIFSYDKKGTFDSIVVNASNLKSSSVQKVSIDWDADPTPPGPTPEPDDGGGLEWYVIVAIAVGVLLIVVIALFFYLRARRNRLKKDSLLVESKADVDEEI